MDQFEWAIRAPFPPTRGASIGTGVRQTPDDAFSIRWDIAERLILHQEEQGLFRDLPEEFGKWGSVYRQFRRWSVAEVWDAMLEALDATGMAPSSVQMIDSTIARAHQHASGEKRGLIRRVLGAREVARRPRSI